MRYKVNSVISQKQGCPINLVAENLQQMTHNFYTIYWKQLNRDRLLCKCCKCFPDVFPNKRLGHMAPYEEERCTAHTFRSNRLATLCDSWCENDWQTWSKSIFICNLLPWFHIRSQLKNFEAEYHKPILKSPLFIAIRHCLKFVSSRAGMSIFGFEDSKCFHNQLMSFGYYILQLKRTPSII